ncbi:MAG: hypothetical protein R3345_11640 [Fulvivirga sp.]|nr:hypothetical protein [Fulvivirga sp.]
MIKHILYFITLGLLLSCEHEDILKVDKESAWEIVWESPDHAAVGKIYLFDNAQARIVIDEPDGLFFQAKEDVNYTWAEKNNQFFLKRLDNNFTLQYTVVEKTESFYKLRFTDDLFVKICK